MKVVWICVCGNMSLWLDSWSPASLLLFTYYCKRWLERGLLKWLAHETVRSPSPTEYGLESKSDSSDDTMGLIIMSGTCCGQAAQCMNDTSGGKSGSGSCWWLTSGILMAVQYKDCLRTTVNQCTSHLFSWKCLRGTELIADPRASQRYKSLKYDISSAFFVKEYFPVRIFWFLIGGLSTVPVRHYVSSYR